MKVCELIKVLQSAPQDAEVEAWNTDGEDGTFSIRAVAHERNFGVVSLREAPKEFSIADEQLYPAEG